MRIKIVLLVLTLVTISVGQLGCDDYGNAQQIETELEFDFSGTFVPTILGLSPKKMCYH